MKSGFATRSFTCIPNVLALNRSQRIDALIFCLYFCICAVPQDSGMCFRTCFHLTSERWGAGCLVITCHRPSDRSSRGNRRFPPPQVTKTLTAVVRSHSSAVSSHNLALNLYRPGAATLFGKKMWHRQPRVPLRFALKPSPRLCGLRFTKPRFLALERVAQ